METNRGAGSQSSAGTERPGTEPRTIAGARLEIAATRTRIHGTVAELEQQMSDSVDSVKRKVDVAALVRRHPWAALTVALVGGVALSASGAERRAARAAARAARRAPDLAKRGAASAIGGTAVGVSQLASAAIGRIRGKSDDRSAGDNGAQEAGGLKAKATGALAAQVRELRDDATRGVDALASSILPSPRTQT
jgi:hypothetical protein